MQVMVFVSDAAPEAFDEAVVYLLALAVHADLDTALRGRP
jgi:hypothetical protein